MRGGKRPGAGRKPSSVNRMSQKAREKAAETGILPHEFLLAVCQGQTIDGHQPDFRERLDAAKAAAPFYAPKLSASENKNEHKGSLTIATGVPRDDDEDDNDND